MESDHMKRCLTIYVIRKLQIKTITFHYTSIIMAKILNTDNTKLWQGCGGIGTLTHFWWVFKMVQPFWNTVWQFLTKLSIFISCDSTSVTTWCLPKWVEHYVHIITHTWIFTLIEKKESEVTQLCLTLCEPMGCSLPGSSVHGIFQARVLEWVAISFFRDLPNPGTEPGSPTLQADALPSEPPRKPINRSFIHNCQNLEANKISFRRWMDKL